MEAMRLVIYRNWSITIHCECLEIEGESSRYFAIAFLAQLRDDSLSMATPLTCPSTVVQLANVWFPTSQLANQAVLSESQRRIDAYNDEHT